MTAYPSIPTFFVSFPLKISKLHSISGTVGYFEADWKVENICLNDSVEFQKNISIHLAGRASDGQVVGKSVQEHLLFFWWLSCQSPYPSLNQVGPLVAPLDDDEGKTGQQET